jgi:hypothetical protein
MSSRFTPSYINRIKTMKEQYFRNIPVGFKYVFQVTW